VATIAGVKPSVLRFWETEFRWLRPDKSPTNQRVYTRKQVERVLEVKSLLYERGFTIAGARKQLTVEKNLEEPDKVQVLTRIREGLRDILTLLERKT